MALQLDQRQEQILTLQDCLEISLALEEQSRGEYRQALRRLSLRLLWLLTQYPETCLQNAEFQSQRNRLRLLLDPSQSPELRESRTLDLLRSRQ
jgi:hypothetical protein